MFTGLVETKNLLIARVPLQAGTRMTFSHTFAGLALGESIAINGACLTVVSFSDDEFEVELSNETLRLTTLGQLTLGSLVNMERALRAGDRLGGHMVTGHIDGVAQVSVLAPEGEMTLIRLDVPKDLAPYVARKGSLTVDGVSLTVNAVEKTLVDLLIIPHTREVTNLGALLPGAWVNIEVDLVARYLARLVEARAE